MNAARRDAQRRRAAVVAMGVQRILGAAQGGHASPATPARGSREVRTLVDADYGANLLAWKTVRDAISDLPDPERHPNKVQTHRFQPRALMSATPAVRWTSRPRR